MITSLPATSQLDRINVEGQANGATMVRHFRVEDMRLSETQAERLKSIRVLMQEESKIAGRMISCGKSEQHRRC